MKKREFLKTTGAALGGAAITGIASITAEAEPQRTKIGSISIRCDKGVKLESVQRAVAVALGRYGCPACGLLGIDLHIGGGDPDPFDINVPGIHGGSFNSFG